MRIAFAIVCFAIFMIGCSSQSDPNDPGNSVVSDSGASSDATAATDAATASDAGVVVSVAPAFKPEMPQIMNDGGAILSAPEIVTVTWTADPNEATYEAFGDAIGASAFWKPVSEYGVGPAVSGATRHVEVSGTPPSTMTEDALDAFISSHVAAAPGNGWPVNTAQTEYVVYTPPSMALTSGAANDCETTDGYHDETSTNAIAHIVYAVVITSCHAAEDVVSYSTEVASHEMIEAATDPHVQSDLAWSGLDTGHVAWDIWLAKQDEIADACEYNDDADYTEDAPFAYGVQRYWSNAGAAAGHSPCVRAPAAPYFNTTPLDVVPITVTTTLSKTAATTKGARIAVGASQVVRFGFYGDGNAGPWAFQVVEGDGYTTPDSPHLTISSDKSAGNNGDIANVTVQVNSVGEKTGILMTAISTRGTEPLHYMPMLIGAY